MFVTNCQCRYFATDGVRSWYEWNCALFSERNASTLPGQKSKIIKKITITKLDKLKLELKSKQKNWNKIRITKFKKNVLKLQQKYLKLQKHC